jgi:hypothetical protein
MGYILNLNEEGTARGEEGTNYISKRIIKNIKIDFRIRAQIATEYKKFGVYFGYSAGTVNYLENYLGDDGGAYSGILRFGLTYKIK